jgi:hypothetical protein
LSEESKHQDNVRLAQEDTPFLYNLIHGVVSKPYESSDQPELDQPIHSSNNKDDMSSEAHALEMEGIEYHYIPDPKKRAQHRLQSVCSISDCLFVPPVL